MGAAASVEAAQAALQKDIDEFNAEYGEIVASNDKRTADGKTPTERLVELRNARDDLLLSARQAVEPTTSNKQQAPDFEASKSRQLQADAMNEEEQAIVRERAQVMRLIARAASLRARLRSALDDARAARSFDAANDAQAQIHEMNKKHRELLRLKLGGGALERLEALEASLVPALDQVPEGDVTRTKTEGDDAGGDDGADMGGADVGGADVGGGDTDAQSSTAQYYKKVVYGATALSFQRLLQLQKEQAEAVAAAAAATEAEAEMEAEVAPAAGGEEDGEGGSVADGGDESDAGEGAGAGAGGGGSSASSSSSSSDSDDDEDERHGEDDAGKTYEEGIGVSDEGVSAIKRVTGVDANAAAAAAAGESAAEERLKSIESRLNAVESATGLNQANDVQGEGENDGGEGGDGDGDGDGGEHAAASGEGEGDVLEVDEVVEASPAERLLLAASEVGAWQDLVQQQEGDGGLRQALDDFIRKQGGGEGGPEDATADAGGAAGTAVDMLWVRWQHDAPMGKAWAKESWFQHAPTGRSHARARAACAAQCMTNSLGSPARGVENPLSAKKQFGYTSVASRARTGNISPRAQLFPK